MSIPVPSEVPEWASGGGALITDPSSGKKAAGWIPAEEPPAQYFNWWMNNVYQWALVVQATYALITRFARTPIPTTNGSFAIDPADGKLKVQTLTGGAAEVHVDLPLLKGERLVNVRVRIHEGSTAGTRALALVAAFDSSTGAQSALAGPTSATGSGAADRTITFNAINHVAGNEVIAVDVVLHTAGDVLYSVEYDVDRTSF